ncbi:MULTISPECIES: DUF3553 domain-containing protein [Pacificibacter]|uniref:DUF3553 domain-containing protein n=1 Tax=Pacificibacter TaxID=1042323 RepID=UPI001C0924C9|nr:MULTISPECIES: DUF3553 domain-containing protein [Pacificibacter]MBU2934915.1 DUF3553 domain-containing protein [Pacificibacter marinus]MDO6616269.1 DUF3553 domain-containing protein [Pacificibacter sp. 1_MG-2023]
MDDLNAMLEPGQIVRHPNCEDWGEGQVQSNINGKLTVMFAQVGKVVIDSRRVALLPVFN